MSFKKTVFVFLTIGALLFCSGCSQSYAPPETRLDIAMQYDNVEYYGIDFLIVEKDGSYGGYYLEDKEYRLTIPVEYAKLEAFGPEKAELVIATTQDGEIQIFNPKGEQMINETVAAYRSLSVSHYGIEMSPDAKSWGFVSWDGNWIFPPEYNMVLSYDGGTFLTFQNSSEESMTMIFGDILADVDWVDLNHNSLLLTEYPVVFNGVVSSDSRFSYLCGRFEKSKADLQSSDFQHYGAIRSDQTILVPFHYTYVTADPDDIGNLYFFAQYDLYGKLFDVYNAQGNLLLHGYPVSQAVGDSIFTNLDKNFAIDSNGQEIDPSTF